MHPKWLKRPAPSRQAIESMEGMLGLGETTEELATVFEDLAHAILTGLFVAYLPFSRRLHMVVSPFVLALKRME